MMATPPVAPGSSEKNVSEKEEGEIMSCVEKVYEKDASGNNYIRKEKFHAVLPRDQKTVQNVRETVR